MLFADGGLHFCQWVVVGSFWFWLLVAALLVGVTAFCENERGFLAFLSVVLFLAVIQLLGDADILGYVWHHPHYVIGGVVLYYLAGIAYSLGRWKLFCDNKREVYDTAKADFLDSNKVTYTNVTTAVVPPHLVKDWKSFLDRRFDQKTSVEYQNGIKFRHHVGRCMTWASYWPCSFFWTMLNDPLRKLFKHAMNRLKSVYDAIAVRSFKGVDQDFAEEPVKAAPKPQLNADGTPIK